MQFPHTMLAAGTEKTFWLPELAAETGKDVDFTFYFIYYLDVLFFIAIIALSIYFPIKYRRSKVGKPEKSSAHNTSLEIAWSIPPTILLGFMFYFGFVGFMDAKTAPADSYEIMATGQMWQWSFQYPEGFETTELHLPVDRNVRIVLNSRDVLHSFFIPAFRAKMDVVPGRYTKLWFRPTKTGKYDLMCAEYCGNNHSLMLADVYVKAEDAFDAWRRERIDDMGAERTPAEEGEKLLTSKGCVACHTVDGTARIGPSFKGIFGKPATLSTGETITVDENYLRESILDSGAKKRAGFEETAPMPPFQGVLSEEEVTNLVAYIKTLAD